MDSYHLCVATAKVKFSDLYWFEQRHCYAFDITFEEASTSILPNLTCNPVGFDLDIAEGYFVAVKKKFDTAGIVESSPVSILFSGNQVLAISVRERDLWIDVREGIASCPYPKSFPVLGINIKSLEIY